MGSDRWGREREISMSFSGANQLERGDDLAQLGDGDTGSCCAGGSARASELSFRRSAVSHRLSKQVQYHRLIASAASLRCG
jgi:hypothetical protein